MTTETTEAKTSKATRLKALSAETPDTDYSKGGRKAKTQTTAGHQQRLDYAAKDAIEILVQRVGQRRKRIAPDLQRACEYVIDHAIGKARQKIEHSGGILTYGSLAKEAEKLASKPRDVLADAEEIGAKREQRLEEIAEEKRRLADIADPETAQRRAGLERMLARADELPEVEPEPVAKSEGTGEQLEAVKSAGEDLEPISEAKKDEPGQ